MGGGRRGEEGGGGKKGTQRLRQERYTKVHPSIVF